MRLGTDRNNNVLYGLATDDTHNYHSRGATPGRGWIMVRSKELNPEYILDALDRGYFYSSTVVYLSQLEYDGKPIRVGIDAEDGIEYLTEFIGNIIPRTHSDDIGTVLASNNALHSAYRLTGDELYVRLKITSSSDQLDQITRETIGKETAWSQPFTP